MPLTRPSRKVLAGVAASLDRKKRFGRKHVDKTPPGPVVLTLRDMFALPNGGQIGIPGSSHPTTVIAEMPGPDGKPVEVAKLAPGEAAVFTGTPGPTVGGKVTVAWSRVTKDEMQRLKDVAT